MYCNWKPAKQLRHFIALRPWETYNAAKWKYQVSGISLTIEQILAILESMPQRIAEFTIGLTETQLHAVANPGEWSINDILVHLRSCSDVWGGNIVTILNQDKPTIRAINPRTWIERTTYPEQKFRPSLQAFTAQRAELLAVLKSAKPKIWSRPATVTGAGTPLETSVQSYARRMAEHDRPHLKQIKRIASTLQN